MIAKDIDEILSKGAAEARQPVDAALLDRITKSMATNLSPVRPLAPAWLLTSGLVLLSIAVAILGAAKLGFYGVRGLSGLERALVFPLLVVLISFAASFSIIEMVPGSRRRASPAWLFGAGAVAWLGVFAVLFRDHQTQDFVHQGVVCLIAGLLVALPASIGIWLLLRRGFAVNPVAAGTIAGTLAGLAGVSMLELHCPNFEVLHILLWHTAVVFAGAGLGALAGKLRTG